jgi:hypothetical protein
MIAFTRHSRIGIHNMAQAPLRWFMRSYAQKFQEPDMLSLLKLFLGRVKLVQRAFRKLLIIRQARVEALMCHFLAADFVAEDAKQGIVPEHDFEEQEDKCMRNQKSHGATLHVPDMKSRAKAQPVVRRLSLGGARSEVSEDDPQAKSTRRVSSKESTRRLSSKESPRDELRKPTRRESTRRTSRDRKAFAESESTSRVPAYVRDYRGVELLPDFLRLKVLREHVYEMQYSFASRMRAFEKRKKDRQIAQDLHDMGFEAEGYYEEQRPRPIELRRLKKLYSNTYDRYLHGDFKSLIHLRDRMMEKYFRAWRRIMLHIKEPKHTAFDNVFHADEVRLLDESQMDAVAVRKQHQRDSLKMMGRTNTSVQTAFGV